MERLRCVVERITYQNEQNGYSVIKCRAKGYQDLVTVVGSMAEVHVGSVLSLTGSWKVDAKYGRQFSMETYEETLPATVYGIEKYLGSGLIKGVGPKFAKRIVEQFGADTLNVIEENPDRLIEVAGIGKLRVERIKSSWQEQKEVKNIMLFLQSHDVSTSHATKIYKTYGNESIQIVQENPYRLADDIWGIGFKTADTIAQKMGFEKEKYVRLRSGILYTLNRLSEDGHCFATRDQLTAAGEELLSVENSLLSITLDEMIRVEDVIIKDIPAANETSGSAAAEPGAEPAGAVPDMPQKAIYLPPFYFSELGAAKRLAAILKNTDGFKVNAEGLAERISRRTHMDYDEIQMQAILTAVRSKILVLTGGPGTGKTTTTLGIITAFRDAGARILLAAPTGRAAKRLSEATGMEAKTLHRLLEVKPPEGYQRNEENPLEGDVLIVDECSMIDIMLMYSLLRAVPDTMTLILVGDIDQLPSVGAGNVLGDLVSSGTIPTVALNEVFRQSMESDIIANAHRINRGEQPKLGGGKRDFFFLQCESPSEVNSTIRDLCCERLPKTYGFSAMNSIQVLSPTKIGRCGTAELNRTLQDRINPQSEDKAELTINERILRAGDKVMQVKNNYNIEWERDDGTLGKGIFNGDLGVLTDIDAYARSCTVVFDDKTAKYTFDNISELELAYCTTVHKSQGNEYDAVIISMWGIPAPLKYRNLLYTAVTRAKKLLIIVGNTKELGEMIGNNKRSQRYTLLRDLLAQDE